MCRIILKYIDLGLPSRKKWATTNKKGYFTFKQALKKFGKKNLPSKEDFQELIDHCKSEWDDVRKGRVFTGPNGNSIFLPAMGYKDCFGTVYYRGSDGDYWSSSIDGEEDAYYMIFDDYEVYTAGGYRSSGCSVRLVQK